MRHFSFIALLSLALGLNSCQQPSQAPQASAVDQDVIALIEDIPTTQAFLQDLVDSQDVTRILNAGINAPSAINKQDWHFSAVTDKSVLEQIAGEMSAGPRPGGPTPGASAPAKAGIASAPLAIIVSCGEGYDLNAGLATQNMSVVAQMLGYGTKIIASPSMVINGEKKDEYKKILGIPESMSMVAVLLVGKTDTGGFDAATMATPRKDFGELVSFVGAK